MQIKDELFKEFIRNGYATENSTKVWNVAERKNLYLTSDLAKAFLNLRKFDIYKKQVVDREIALIQAHIPKLKRLIGNEPFNLIDVFCGDGKKSL